MNKPKQVKQARIIPLDLLETEIIPRLPIQSLLRFKLVSKRWLAVISSPEFTKLYLHQSISSQRDTFLVESSDGSLKFLDLAIMHASNKSKDDEVIYRPLNPYHDSKGRKIKLVDSSNGLICLAIDNDKYCFFNPVTRVCREVICPKDRPPLHDCYIRAFGYSRTRDEYKLVYVDRRSGLLNVYTLRSNDDPHNWRESSVDVLPYSLYSRAVGKVINEKAHWIVKGRRYNDNAFGILAFDLNRETFNEVSLPQICGRDMFICDLEQNLSVCHEQERNNRCYLEVWMMRRYGESHTWSRIYNFDLCRNPVIDRLSKISILSNSWDDITSEGRKSFFAVLYREIILVKDLNMRQPSYFKVLRNNNYSDIRSIRRHVNSLVSPFLC